MHFAVTAAIATLPAGRIKHDFPADLLRRRVVVQFATFQMEVALHRVQWVPQGEISLGLRRIAMENHFLRHGRGVESGPDQAYGGKKVPDSNRSSYQDSRPKLVSMQSANSIPRPARSRPDAREKSRQHVLPAYAGTTSVADKKPASRDAAILHGSPAIASTPP